MIRVVLPAHLKQLVNEPGEVVLDVGSPLTQRTLIDALEARYPVLVGTIRDPTTQRRRAYVRFFACEDDLSHQPLDAPLPREVEAGLEPFFVIGAMAGG